MKSILTAALFLTALSHGCAPTPAAPPATPKACGGAPVRSEDDAVARATLALSKAYGAKAVERQRPYYARRDQTSEGTSWSVYGTNPDQEQIAGNFNVLLNAETGCIEAMQIDH